MSNPLKLKVQLMFNEAEAMRNLEAQMRRMQNVVNRLSAKQSAGINTMNQGMAQTTARTAEATRGFRIFGTTAESAVNSMLRMALVAPIIGVLSRSLRDAVGIVMEIDKAFTNFKIVTGASAIEIRAVDAEATRLSNTLGKLKSEVINATTEFARAGYTMEQSLKLAEVGISAANVGFTTLDKTTKFLIAGMKSFNIDAEDSARIMDVLFQVSNKTAITLEGIGEAFLRAGNSMQVAGASLEQTTAMLAAANESIQDPAKVGTALKTISARLRGVSEDGEIIPTLTRDFNALGIEILNADGSFRNIYDIFNDLSGIFHELSDLTQQNLIEKLAGKRQSNILIGMLNNWETAQYALNEALQSQGTVMEANEVYIDSIEGRIKILKNTVNSFYESMMSSDFIKVVIEFFKGVIGFLDLIINKIPILGVAITALLIKFNVLTGGIPLAIGKITTVLLGIAQGMKIFGNETKKAEKAVDDASKKMAELNSEIANMEALEERTAEQDKLLEILKEQLEVEKELKRVAEGKVAEGRFKDMLKEVADLNYGMELMRGHIQSISEDTSLTDSEKTKAIAKMRESMLELLKTTQDNHVELENIRRVFEDVGLSTEDVTFQIERNVEQMDYLKEVLTSIGMEHIFVKDATEDTAKETKELVDELSALDRILKDVDSLLSSAVDEYKAYSDALKFISENGYISIDMLKELQKYQISFVEDTNLNVDKMVEKLTGLTKATREGVAERIKLMSLELMAHNITTEYYNLNTNSIIKGMEDQRAIALSNAKSYTELMAIDAKYTDLISEQRLALNELNSERDAERLNIQNRIALLENLSKIIEDMGKVEEKTTGSGSRTKSPLTELERQLRDVNHQITIHKKQMENITDIEERKLAEQKLISLYEEKLGYLQKLKDIEVGLRDSTNRNTIEFDNLSDSVNKLEVEILDLVIATDRLRNGFSDIAPSANQRLIELVRTLKELDFELEKYNKFLSVSKEDEERIRIEQEMIRLYKEKRTALQEQISIMRDQHLAIENGTAEWYDYLESIRRVELQVIDMDNAIINAERSVMSMGGTVEDLSSKLSKLDKTILEINYNINMLNKELSRTEGDVERIHIYQHLQELYAERIRLLEIERAMLIGQRNAVEDGTQAFDELTSKIRATSLEIEDYTNNMYNATKAVDSLIQAHKTASLKAFQDKAISALNAYYDGIESNINAEIKRLRGLIEGLREMPTDVVRRGESIDSELEVLKENLSALRDINKAKLDNYDLEKEMYEFRKRVAEMNREIANKEMTIEMLMLDDSLESQRLRAKLGEDVAKDKLKLEEMVNARKATDDRRAFEESLKLQEKHLENQISLLDKQKKQHTEYVNTLKKENDSLISSYQKQVDALRDQLRTIADTRRQNIQQIRDTTHEDVVRMVGDVGRSFNNLSRTIISGSSGMGSGIIREINTAANQLMRDYERFMRDIQNRSNINSGIGGSHTGGDQDANRQGTSQLSLSEIRDIAEMQANSLRWHSSDDETRKKLHERNILLASSHGFQFKNGVWYKNNKPVYDLYNNVNQFDNGGKLNKGEMAFNKNQDNEWVLTDKNLLSIFDKGLTNIMSKMLKTPHTSSYNKNNNQPLIHIGKMENAISSNVDVEKIGENLAKGAMKTIRNSGLQF